MNCDAENDWICIQCVVSGRNKKKRRKGSFRFYCLTCNPLFRSCFWLQKQGVTDKLESILIWRTRFRVSIAYQFVAIKSTWIHRSIEFVFRRLLHRSIVCQINRRLSVSFAFSCHFTKTVQPTKFGEARSGVLYAWEHPTCCRCGPASTRPCFLFRTYLSQARQPWWPS